MGLLTTRIGIGVLVGLKLGTMGISEAPHIINSILTWGNVAYGIENAIDDISEKIGKRYDNEENAESEHTYPGMNGEPFPDYNNGSVDDLTMNDIAGENELPEENIVEDTGDERIQSQEDNPTMDDLTDEYGQTETAFSEDASTTESLEYDERQSVG